MPYAASGLVATVLMFAATLVAWNQCTVDPDGGGGFAILFLFVTALLCMPIVGLVTGALAVLTNARLRRTPRWIHLRNRIPIGITIAGTGVLIGMVVFWTIEGAPPTGYCDMATRQ